MILDDFFARALIGGIGVALTVGPLGCFIVWRRMAYYGDTLAHASLLGVALAFLFEIHLTAGIFFVVLAVSIALVALERFGVLSTDALLGILSHGTLALGLVLVAAMTWLRIDLMGFLFGDILSVSQEDLVLVYGGGVLVLGVLVWLWRELLAATVNTDLAAAEGLHPERSRFIFMVLVAIVIAIAMKIVGILLITALLIIPAATARRLAATPEQMAVIASLLGVVAVTAGLFGSLRLDTPSGPSIVVAALFLFLLSLLPWRSSLVKAQALRLQNKDS